MGSQGHFMRYDDDDPGFEYHQDYYDPSRKNTLIPSVVVVVVTLTVVYQILYKLDFNLLPLRQFLWNGLVFFTPYRLLELLDDAGSLDSLLNSATSQPSLSAHSLKSEKMRRVLGLDKGTGIMGAVTQASRRRLSLLPGHNSSHEKEGIPPGLGNWDNSCYQNSMLQGLASLDSISEYLVEPAAGLEHEHEGSHMQMAGSLRELIEQLRDPENGGKRIWTPATLKNMSSWQQQDAQEYFSKVLDEVDREVAKATLAANGVGAQTGSESDEASNTSTRSLNTTRNPLEGMLAQRVGCTTCGFSEGLSMIPFNCLTVPIGRAYEYDVAECLDAYTKLERIEGVECGKCTLLKNQRLLMKLIERMSSSPENADKVGRFGQRLEAVTEALEEDDYDEKTLREKCEIPPKNRVNTIKSRQAVIARPPKSLAIHINRSLFDEMTGELRKNYADVRFPKILDLGSWCLGSHGSGEEVEAEEWLLDPARSMIASSNRSSRVHGPIYELRAVVTHYGRHENGHYICYRKHPAAIREGKERQEDAWWRLSDDDVTKATEEDVLGQGGVFMLFYDRIPNPTTTPPVGDSSIPITEAAVASLEETESYAADVPLPDSPASSDVDSASDIGDTEVPNIDLPTSIPMSRDQSQASSDSADGHTDRSEQIYQGPAKPIMIKPFIQPHGYRKPENDDSLTRKPPMSSSGLVMV